MKKLLKFLSSRVVLVEVAILVQILVLVSVIWKFNNYFIYFYCVCLMISAAAVLWIVNNKSNPSYKIAWIIPILMFPIFGGLFYLMFGGNKLGKKTKEKMKGIEQKTINVMTSQTCILKEIQQQSETAANQSRYIQRYAHNPPYQNTSTEYLSLGEIMFDRLKEELRTAEHYIFLEYFIIEEGVMWNSILGILVQKVQEGVDVRVIFDDAFAIMLLPYQYNKKLRSMGIKCCVFNPVIPVVSSRLNNRDHRKITVIDGHTGFTGGINLADEYINAYEKYGHWKDTAIMLKGDAVWSLTVMFLTLWDYLNETNDNYEQYRPKNYDKSKIENDGFVQPFTDNPLDDESVGETVYLNMINKANRYIYINTPYLIIDNELFIALSSAAKSGIDVRIVTPHIPDKRYVHMVTRSYYEALLESGVKIYEYTPGFVHAKTFVVDDEYGVVGTINLDYRSLYLHFECGVWMYKTKSILQMKEDYLKTLNLCQQISIKECQNIKWYKRLVQAVLRIFAPLL